MEFAGDPGCDFVTLYTLGSYSADVFMVERGANIAGIDQQLGHSIDRYIANAKNLRTAKAAPIGSGDVWTWTGIDADTKLIISWHVGDRHHGAGMEYRHHRSKQFPRRSR